MTHHAIKESLIIHLESPRYLDKFSRAVLTNIELLHFDTCSYQNSHFFIFISFKKCLPWDTIQFKKIDKATAFQLSQSKYKLHRASQDKIMHLADFGIKSVWPIQK